VHWPMWVIDDDGERTGDVMDPGLPEGDFRELVRRFGPMVEETWPNAATSGNAWSRTFLERALPMPEVLTGVDIFLSGLAAALGRFVTLPEPQGLYRVHASNLSSRLTFERMLSLGTTLFDEQCRALAALYRSDGSEFAEAEWRAHAWWPRLAGSLERLEGLLEPDEPFVLVDADCWGVDEVVRGHRLIPFPERDGVYWGVPEGDEAMISELRRRIDEGIRLVVFAWPAFWWLEEYREFAAYLASHSREVLHNDHIRVFSLVP
jgi:hypothetical protein